MDSYVRTYFLVLCKAGRMKGLHSSKTTYEEWVEEDGSSLSSFNNLFRELMKAGSTFE